MATPSAIATVSVDVTPLAKNAKSLAEAACAANSHRIRKFDYQRDLQDLKDICANVYGGTDYMPRIIHRIAKDPGVLVLAAEVAVPESQQQQQRQRHQEQKQGQQCRIDQDDGQPAGSPPGSCIDGIVCGERRGGAVWLFGLRVREGTRGRGLGHVLMEAICKQAPHLLAASPDAEPPPPLAAAPTSGSPLPAPPSDPQHPGALGLQPASHTPQPPAVADGPSAAAAATVAAARISQIITCTVTYNGAAQRIIGRQLPGPLYEVEVWPAMQVAEEYEAAVGWVRGVGVPPGSPHMLDWLPGVRQILDSDAAAQALLPYWRRVTSGAVLRSAVSELLYGSRCGGGCGGGENGAGDGDGSGSEGGGRDPASSSSSSSQEDAASTRPCGGLLWLPMPFDLWPLDSAFVQRELAAGNIWVLREPEPGREEESAAAAAASAAATDGDSVLCSEGDCAGDSSMAVGEQEVDEQEAGGAVVGLLLLTHFATLDRVCAGILARSNAATHAAISHAGRLHPHFWTSALRIPAGCLKPPPSPPPAPSGDARVPEPGREDEAEPGKPLPAVYGVTGGHKGVLMYGGGVATPTRL